jgi:hypothetical protein
MLLRWMKSSVLAASLITVSATGASAQEAAAKAADKPAAAAAGQGGEIALAGGKLLMKVPPQWKAVPPKSQIVQYEFAAPANEEQSEHQARITIMAAGGSIDANIDRWYTQFEQPDGKPTKDKSKYEKFQAGGQTVHWVEIPGTFKDAGGGPFAPQRAPVMREKYRMLGAIIETEKMGQHFIKITGPEKTVEQLSDDLRKSLEGLVVQ